MLNIQDKTVIRKADFWIASLVLAITGFVVSPILGWIANVTLSKEQIQHPFIILCFAAFLIIQHHSLRLTIKLETSNLLIRLLVICYASILAAYLIPFPLFTVFPLVVYSGALILFIFGKRHFQLSIPLLAAFTAFLAIAIYIPYLDWPLRQFAGRSAAYALSILGFDTQLAIQVVPENVQLLMKVGPQVFHVASECNGYGMLSSSILLSVIASLALKNGWQRLLLATFINLGIAYITNVLRIIAITQLAPHFVDNYMLMHEAAGISYLLIGLYLAWRVCLLIKKRPTQQS